MEFCRFVHFSCGCDLLSFFPVGHVQARNAGPVLDVRANKPTGTPKLRVTPIQAPKLKLPTKALPDFKTAEPDLPVLEAATTPAQKPKLELPPNEPEPVQALKVSK